MTRSHLVALVFSLLLPFSSPLAAENAQDGTQQCLSCHDYSEQSPIAPLLDSPHWQEGSTANPRAKQGCESCHGDSSAHAERPTQQAPAVSFGPRWNSGVDKQTAQCQSCHGDNAGQHWEGGKHQQENLTCNSCHSGHAAEDKAIASDSQRETCVLCHKQQKKGMHDLSAKTGETPACSQCHNPHGNPDAKIAMLDNRSAGCVHCHNLLAMSKAPGANAKATSYHKTMAQKNRLCTDCHQQIAHVSTEGVTPIVAQAVRKKTVTLFNPGQADSEWLTSKHPGAQSLRQGRDCEQCHQGEEAAMGESLAKRGEAASRPITVSFNATEELMRMTLRWQGAIDDPRISIMWGNDGNEAFQRGGCWASCHADMPGMSQDRGQAQGKYLWVARAQQQRIGQPARLKSASELADLRRQGNYVEVWQASMTDSDQVSIESGTLLETLSWAENSELSAQAEYDKGHWRVTFERPLKGGPGGAKSFLAGKQYTFGVALQSAKQAAGSHWVSLPMTFSLDNMETDFVSPGPKNAR